VIAYVWPVSPLVPRLGAHPDDHGTAFAVFSRGEAVDLCLLDDDGGERRVPLSERTHDVWHGYLPGVRPGQRYGYRVQGPWDPGHGHRFDHGKLLVDPYARAIDGTLRLDPAVLGPAAGADDRVADGRDSAPYVPHAVVFHPGYDWQGDRRPEVPWADTVVYETHVKGFTAAHPGVPAHLRGTYAGLGHPAAVEHLLSLGVTSIELLPVQQLSSEPTLLRRGQTNYWGYNTLGFFAPHAGYSSSGARGQQVTEFRDMVRALHAAGLEVLLDVVYNHTAEGGVDGPTLSWRGLDNAAYYRLTGGRRYVDVTGCGNTLDLRHPRALAMVTDSLRYWVEELHVDGFRFDLAPALARGGDGFEATGTFLSVIAQDPVLSTVKLVAEPWDVGPGGYQLGGFPAPWAEWNDRYRDTVRDSWLGGHGRGRSHAGGVRDLAYRLSGSSDLFAARGPLASVNFVTAHDGFTLHDVVSYDRKHNEANGEDNRDGTDSNHSWGCGAEGPTDDAEVLALRRRMMRNLLATLLTSTGVPMLTAGDEVGRTQSGNNNAYCIDDETSWLSWQHEPWQDDLLTWTRALLALRAAHPVLRHDEVFDGRPAHPDGTKDLAWFGTDGEEMSPERWFDHDLHVLGMYLSGKPDPDGSAPDPLLVLLNTGADPVDARLPGKTWGTSYDVLLDTADERPAPGGTHEAGADVTLAGRTVVVLAAHR
jgi:glycogen operon protein